MQQKKRALGRGLSALLPVSKAAVVPVAPEIPITTTPAGEPILRLKLDELMPNPKQPRSRFTDEGLQELADSIKRHGLIQPVAVTPRSGKYLIVAGERRWRAAKLAGLPSIPAILLELEDRDILEYALVENLQRENLNAMEEARAYQSLISSFGLSQEDVADRVGKSRPAVANSLRLLKLPAEVQGDVEAGLLSAGHARALLSVDDPDRVMQLRTAIVEKGLSVRDVERLATEEPKFKAKPRTKKSPDVDPNLARLREQLIEAVSCRVTIKSVDEQRGKIEIYYNSLDELERVLAVMGVETQ